MSHFTLEDWVDFARVAAPTKKRTAMQQHLDQGCQKCSSTLKIWTKVLELASRESSYQPPESAVHWAKALFRPQQRENRLPVTGIIAQLLFDSFRQPLLAGVRGAGKSARRLLYHSGGYKVDVSDKTAATFRKRFIGDSGNIPVKPQQKLQHCEAR